MKKSLLNPVKTGLLLASFLLVCGIASGTGTYTAIASGDWSNSATWSGGTVPPTTLGAGDQVTIAATYTVTMDNNVTINGLLASLDVEGTLTSTSNITLNLIYGNITSTANTGSITATKIVLGASGALSYTGSIVADTLSNAIVGLASAAQITVNDVLMLPAVLNVTGASSSLTTGSNATILISGGGLASSSGGTLDLSANYNVEYITSSSTTGLELSGSGLKKVIINVGSSNNVTLNSNLTTNDSLKFVSGSLVLNGYNLTANDEVSGDIMIAGNSSSNLTINTSGGLASYITFTSGFQNLNNLTVNVGSGHSVILWSALAVHGNVALTSGNLDMSGESLMVEGNITGSGSLMTTTGSDLSLTTTNSITGNLSLSGSGMGKFTMNIGSGHTVTLATDLNADTLDLGSGTLILNGKNLSVNGDITASGTGTVHATPASNVSVTSAAAVHGSLAFDVTGKGDTVNNLTVNVSGNGSVKLGSDLVIKGTLDFTKGYVDVSGNNLSIGAAGSVTGAGATSYVITSGSGDLTMNASVGDTTTFQVGTSANYLPAAITLNTGSASGTIGVNVSAGVYSQGTTGTLISSSQPMVDATWFFQNNIGSGINANMQLSWSSSAEVNGFTRTKDYISHFVSGAWDNIGDATAASVSGSMYSVTRANVTSMSPFAVFDQETVPTGIDEVANTTGAIEIYPNPAHTTLNIKNNNVGNNTGVIYAEIYNTLGQMVSNYQLNNSALVTIPVYGLSAGTYLIRFYNDNMEVVEKFSKL